MTAENDFLIFANDATNIESQAAYVADSAVPNGEGSGTASSSRYNKTARQGTTAMALLAAFIQQQNPSQTVLDQGETGLPTLLASLTSALQSISPRIRLQANLNLYVATTGSDSNTGLTSGSPFLTLQKAWNTIIQDYDLAGFTVTVNVANGTYTGEVFCTAPALGTTGSIRNEPTQPAPNVIFQGNPGTPSAVTIDVVNGNCFHVGGGAQISVNGFTLLASGTSSNYNTEGTALYTFANGGIQFSNIIFGACSGAHIQSTAGSTVESLGNPYTITGSAPAHTAASSGGYVAVASSAVTLSGTPNFSSGFAFSSFSGIINVSLMTFSGGATGPYFTVDTNGVLESGGAITSVSSVYLPGNANGIQNRGGQFS